MAETQWLLAEQGILGPNGFVPWEQALAYKWQDSNILAIMTEVGFAGARRFTIPALPDLGPGAAAILASKLPRH